MANKIVTTPEAKCDLEEITKYYFEINPNLALKFLSNLDEVKMYILRNPMYFQKRYQNIRTVMVSNFPYSIHYFLEEKTISISGVYHVSKNPKTWR